MKTLMPLLVLAVSACAQQLDLSTLDRLASKAKESANVNLDQDKMRLASGFMSSDDPDQKKTKELLDGMKGVFVRSFEFEKPGEYSLSDLEPIRRQLQGAGWSKIVDVKSKDEVAEVYFFSQGNQPGGIAIISAEPKEIAVVNIVGKISMEALGGLSGKFGIPNVVKPKPAPAPKPQARD